MNYYIYKITNKINRKCYIGQSGKIRDRWVNHKRASQLVKSGQKTLKDSGIQVIHCAIAKHGIENFVFQIIEEVDSLDQANDRETYWVGHYDSYHNGYNCTHGGSNSPKTKEWKFKVKATRIANDSYGHSEETKEYLSKCWHEHHPPESIEKTAVANRGRATPPEVRQKLSEANKGKQNCLGHKQSQETIEKRKATQDANYGSKVCNAPGCDRADGFKYEGKRYCEKHVQRLKAHGSLESPPRPKPHLGKKWSQETKRKMSEGRKGKCTGFDNPFYGKKHSEETIEHLRKINLGKEPPNKKRFSDEQINKIASDSRSLRKIAADWNVSTTVIRRLKKTHANQC